MILQGFVGPTDTLRSPNANVEETINFYEEGGQPGTPKVSPWLVPTPCVAPFVVLPNGPVRGLFSQNGRAFAAGSTVVMELTAVQTLIPLGLVASSPGRAYFDSNGTAGNQLSVSSGGFGYILNLTTNLFTQIVDPGFLLPTAMILFADGYFVSLHEGTRQFQISDLEDGLNWDPTDVFEISQTSDNLIAMAWVNRNLWLWGSQNYSVWANIGDADNPFQPIPGASGYYGIMGPDTWEIVDSTVYWLAQNARGQRIVMRANGYNAEKVSSAAIDFRLSQYPILEDAVCWSYQEAGHSFFCLTPQSYPTDPTVDAFTFCYDTSTGRWHQRAVWDVEQLRWKPYLARCAAFGFNEILVGDRQSPAVYTLRSDRNADVIVELA